MLRSSQSQRERRRRRRKLPIIIGVRGKDERLWSMVNGRRLKVSTRPSATTVMVSGVARGWQTCPPRRQTDQRCDDSGHQTDQRSKLRRQTDHRSTDLEISRQTDERSSFLTPDRRNPAKISVRTADRLAPFDWNRMPQKKTTTTMAAAATTSPYYYCHNTNIISLHSSTIILDQ